MIRKILTLIFLLFMFACGENTPTSKTLNYWLNEEGPTLDTSLVTDGSGVNIHAFLSEGLTKTDIETKKSIPGLAEKYEISSDGLTWTFHLRDNIKWSNGDPITANDFKFAWLRALDPKTASQYSFILYPIKNAREYNSGEIDSSKVGINVIDDKTLEVKLVAPTPYFDSLTSFVTYLPINEKFVKEKGEKYALDVDGILSSGAYILKKWTHNSQMTLEKNPNYYAKDKISTQTVNIKFIGDSASSLNAFKNDEIDFVSLTSEQFDEFKDDKRLKVLPLAQVYYLMYNHKNEILKNVKIRRAIDLAIDKEEMNKMVFNNLNSVNYNFTPNNVGMPGLNTNDFGSEVGQFIPKYNPNEAKKLLAEGLKELGLEKLPKLTLIVNDMDGTKKACEAIQEYLRINLGIELDIQLMTYKERLQRQSSGNFEISMNRWGADYRDAMTFLDLFVSSTGTNAGKYANKNYDKLIDLAKNEVDKAKRFEYLKEVEKIIGEDIPITVLYQVNKYYLVNERLSNYSFSSVNSDLFTETVIK